MGREIRRVPKGWQHPKDKDGDYLPMIDKDYPAACAEWKQGYQEWENKTHKSYTPDYPYWDYDSTPSEDYCRPIFESEPVCYQIYETVTEGTPTSPVFETLDELVAWLVAQGYSQKAAESFAKDGWAPSFVYTRQTGLIDGIKAGEIDTPATE